MRHRASAVCLFALAAAPMPAIAGPVRVTDIYASLPGADTAYHLDDQGNLTPFTPPVATFMQFFGSEFDRATGRLLFYGIFDNATRIGAVDADFDPASLTVVRDNMPANSGFVDVDPATGRVYWWQDGQILSALPADTGTPVVEAMGVPTPVQLEVDAAHGVYLAITGLNYDVLASGPLDGNILPYPLSCPSLRTGSSPTSRSTRSPATSSGPRTRRRHHVYRRHHPHAQRPLRHAGRHHRRRINRRRDRDVRHRRRRQPDRRLRGPSSPSAVPRTSVRLRLRHRVRDPLRRQPDGACPGIDLDYELDPVYEHPESLRRRRREARHLHRHSPDPAATFLWGLDGQLLADDGRISGRHRRHARRRQRPACRHRAVRLPRPTPRHPPVLQQRDPAVRPAATCVADVDGNGIQPR
ncbi:MAG: hypothetical protein R3B49_03260 [Phycisphaerales bacterium]